MIQFPLMTASSTELCEQILKLLDRLRLVYADFAERHGLTKVQLIALFTISETEDEMAMSRFAQCLHCDASNVTGIVDRLAAQGLLIRSESARDRRVKTLALTPRGKQLIADLKEVLPQRLGCDNLNRLEQRHMHALLVKMID